MIYIFFSILIIILLIGIFIILKKIGVHSSENYKSNTDYLILDEKYQNLAQSSSELKNDASEKNIVINNLREQNLHLTSENAKLQEKAERLTELADSINEFQKKF
ncbi:MAG: hypothetical protein GY756_13740, partial [bacterium]|nr:hypothetical protein [bacterium]